MNGEYLDICIEETENESIENAWKLLTASKSRTFVAVQISPAVRVSIAEKLGMQRGEDGVGKLVAAMTALGADVVVDTAIAMDALTLTRAQMVCKNKQKGGSMPVFSSECSEWVEYAKENYPEITLLPTVTTVCAKMLKNYYGKAYPDKKIRVIALEMGKAKKADPGVDVVLTLDELSELLWETGVNIRLLKKMPLSVPFGGASGGSYIAASSGGDAESVMRCLSADKTYAFLRKLEYSGLYGVGNCRKARITVGDNSWNFAVVDSLEAVDSLMEEIRSGAMYDYVEITACAGGCVGANCADQMTRRLRKLGLKYLDFARSARSADVNPAALAFLKQWNAICRNGKEKEYDEIDEILFDFDDIVEEIAEEVAQYVAEEVANTIAVTEVSEEPIEELVEETVEEIVEESVEETVEEIVEESVEETVEEIVEESVEETVEEIVEESVEETVEEIVEEFVEETVEETVGEIVEETVKQEEVAEAIAHIEEILEKDDSELTAAEKVAKAHYYRRLSTKERRKLKRQRKNQAKR